MIEELYKQVAYSKPGHYTGPQVDPRDYATMWGMDFNEGNVIKYVTRWKHKGGLDDLYKARDYLNYIIERNEGAQK